MLLQKLQSLGFVSGVDFSLVGEELTALPKSRDVVSMIHHPEVPAIKGSEGDIIVPAIPAFDQPVITQEQYFAQLPSIADLKRLCVLDSDPAMLVSEYLSDKTRSDEDSFNLHLFLSGNASGWRFESVPAPSMAELFDLIAPVAAKLSQDSVNAEALKFLADTDYMIVREAEGGAACSTQIKTQRAAARARIVR